MESPVQYLKSIKKKKKTTHTKKLKERKKAIGLLCLLYLAQPPEDIYYIEWSYEHEKYFHFQLHFHFYQNLECRILGRK